MPWHGNPGQREARLQQRIELRIGWDFAAGLKGLFPSQGQGPGSLHDGIANLFQPAIEATVDFVHFLVPAPPEHRRLLFASLLSSIPGTDHEVCVVRLPRQRAGSNRWRQPPV